LLSKGCHTAIYIYIYNFVSILTTETDSSAVKKSDWMSDELDVTNEIFLNHGGGDHFHNNI
jgi:hypothetical protein